MNGDDFGRLIYLGLLGAAVAGWFIAQNRQSASKTAQQAAVWGLIFIGVIAAIGLWSDIRRTTLRPVEIGTDQIEIPRAADGHFHLNLKVNSVPVGFLIDTGATNIVLSQQDATRIGIDTNALRYLGEAATANGTVRIARIRLDTISIGDFTDSRVAAYVNQGDMEGSLLGMDYLNRFSEVSIRSDIMILRR